MATRHASCTDGRKALNALLQKTKQAEVAAKIGTNQQSVSRWAVGSGRPDLILRAALELHFGIAATLWLTKTERERIGLAA